MQRSMAPLQNDSFINQLAGAAADFAAGRSCQTNQLFFPAGNQALLEGFLHNTPPNPFVRCRAAPMTLRFLPTCSPGSNGRIVWSCTASPRIAAICRHRAPCVSLPATLRSQEKQGEKKKKAASVFFPLSALLVLAEIWWWFVEFALHRQLVPAEPGSRGAALTAP